MKILQIGVPKSGNYWLYKIIQSIIKYSGVPMQSFIKKQNIAIDAKTWNLSFKEQAGIDVLDITNQKNYYRISSKFREPIEDIDDYINQCTHVWTHSKFCHQSSFVLKKFDKIIYIIRDPRDVAISFSKFVFTPYMKEYYPSLETNPEMFLKNRLPSLIANWVLHVSDYLDHRNDLKIHFIFYERMLNSLTDELNSLMKYLNIQLDETIINQIKNEVTFQTMSNENSKHVRKGISGQWVEVLNDQQKNQAVQIAKPLLNCLNYPTVNTVETYLPSLPPQLSSMKMKIAILRAKVNRGIIKLRSKGNNLVDTTQN